eukprot:8836268-Karenia_brevis.AAC.1
MVRHTAPRKAAGATSAQLRRPPPNMRAGSRARALANTSWATCWPRHTLMTLERAASTARAAASESAG